MKNLLLTVILPLSIVIALFSGTAYLDLTVFPLDKPPSDAKLLANFKKHEKVFVELKDKVCKGGYSVVSMDPEWSNPKHIPDGVIKSYYALFKEVGVSRIQSDKSCSVDFSIWAVGLGGSGAYKGFYYNPGYKAKVVKNLDDVSPDKATLYLRHIRGSWYLYYDYYP